MINKIISTVLFLFLITNYNGLIAIAQEGAYVITINPGATNSASQNPIAPANLTVPKDTNVTWVNNDSTFHQIISGSPDTGPSNLFYGDYFGPGEAYNVTFDNAGIYQYYDPVWSHINGQITVENLETTTTTEIGSIENTSGATSPDQVLGGDSASDEIDSNISVLNNSASSQSPSSISSLFGSLASDGNNQSSVSTWSTLSTDQTLESIIDKVGPFVRLLTNANSVNSLNDTLDSIIFASNQSNHTIGENMMSEANINGSEPTLQVSDKNFIPYLNDTFSLQNSSSFTIEDEKIKAQDDLADSLRKAISIGAKIPEITGFEDDNATVYIKVNVINPIDRMANTSDFPIQINYEDTQGIPGVSLIFVNEAGMIQKLPASTYNIIAGVSQTGDQSLDAFLNSYLSTYSEGCSGSVSYMETEDCIITKEYANTSLNNNTR
ncbi:MAG TPA: hypothetical protein VD815_10405 [Candidatus Saccharimonadales bacterium]|nr:hypothetical protein [Candidatus Saccharimonadales bacterium]